MTRARTMITLAIMLMAQLILLTAGAVLNFRLNLMVLIFACTIVNLAMVVIVSLMDE